jgi:6-phosphogluconolactonase (cycloisomerase 2 family)
MNGNQPRTADPEARRRSGRIARLALLAAIFALPAAGRLLDFVGAYVDGTVSVPDGLDGASGVAISRDGRHVYATGRRDDALVVFVRDATAETLTFVEVLRDQVGGVFGLDGASSVTVSPDGRHVYATGAADDALAVFARDASADALVFVEDHQDGVGGVFGLDGASSVTVSDDGRHVYVTGGLADAVAVFARDASLDALTFAGAQVNGSGGVDGLAGARAVAVDPFRGRVYVAGAVDDAVAVFARDPVGHGLSYLFTLTDGKARIDGLDGAAALLLTPDGAHLYVAGRDEDAIAVFDFPAGSPRLVQVARGDRDEGLGLERPTALALSADGRYLYASTAGAGSVAAFRREPDGALAFLGSGFALGHLDLRGTDALAASPDGKHLFAASRALDLVALLRQDAVFSDGFESGDLSQWSGSAP